MLKEIRLGERKLTSKIIGLVAEMNDKKTYKWWTGEVVNRAPENVKISWMQFWGKKRLVLIEDGWELVFSKSVIWGRPSAKENASDSTEPNYPYRRQSLYIKRVIKSFFMKQKRKCSTSQILSILDGECDAEILAQQEYYK